MNTTQHTKTEDGLTTTTKKRVTTRRVSAGQYTLSAGRGSKKITGSVKKRLGMWELRIDGTIITDVYEKLADAKARFSRYVEGAYGMQGKACATYSEVDRASSRFGETRDCSVKAVALLTRKSYTASHQALAECGRRNRSGATTSIMTRAIGKLGYEAGQLGPNWVPPTVDRCSRLRHGRYLVITCNHALAVVDGEVLDWTKGRRHRPKQVFLVKRKSKKSVAKNQ